MTKLPKITFRAMEFKENMDMISMFIQNELDKKEKPNTTFFKNKYFEIKNIDFSDMNIDQISDILQSKLLLNWQEEMKNAKEKIIDYQSNWDLINDSVMLDLSNLLNIKWPDDTLDIQARVGVMHFCPRYIGRRLFDTAISFDVSEMFETAIHEVCHFLYFEKWKELYNDYDESHYNYPHIIWYLSEAIIDPLLNNDVFKKYTNKDIPSYQIFYETIINNKSIIEHLKELLINKPIEDAIKDSYNFFIDNKNIIETL